MNTSRRNRLLLTGLVAVLAIVGIFLLGPFGTPESEPKEIEWGETSEERIEIITTVWIDNPNPGFSADADITYIMSMNDYKIADGKKSGVSVPHGNHTETLNTNLRQEQLPKWWASHVQNGGTSDVELQIATPLSVGLFSAEPTVTIERKLEIDLEQALGKSLKKLEDEYSREFDIEVASREVTVSPEIIISDTAVSLEANETKTNIRADVEVENPNQYPLPLPSFTGGIDLNELKIATWSIHEIEVLSHERDAVIRAGDSETISFGFSINNEKMVDWFSSHVENNERTDAVVSAQLALTINGKQITIPSGTGPYADDSGVACTFGVETDMLALEKSDSSRAEFNANGCNVTRWNVPTGQLTDFDLAGYISERDGLRCEVFPNLPLCNSGEDPDRCDNFPNLPVCEDSEDGNRDGGEDSDDDPPLCEIRPRVSC